MTKSVREVSVPYGTNTSPNGGSQLKRTKYWAFAERLREAADREQLSQAKLAQRLKLTSGTFSRYWSGERLPPSDTLIDLSEALNVAPSWLIRGVSGLFEHSLRSADDSDWVDLPEYDLRELSDGGKGVPIGSTKFRRDWLYLSLGDTAGLWVARLLAPDQALGLPAGAPVVCKDHPEGEHPVEGQHYIFRVNGGILLARFSYRGPAFAPPGETTVGPADLDREDGQHFIVARVLGALARPFV